MNDHDLNNWFTFHPVHGGQAERYQQIRAAARIFATTIAELTPPGPDQTVAIRTVREAVMWANAAIACGEVIPVVIPPATVPVQSSSVVAE